ncbi:MAG: hypothetical protein JXR68_11490 [Bacteroidales bacterium]|nr:hypothetical protein [Bacteroidales bacterium]
MRKCLNNNISLKLMETIDYMIKKNDTTEKTDVNFIII